MSNQFDKIDQSEKTETLEPHIGSRALNAALLFSSRRKERLKGKNDNRRRSQAAPATD